MWLRGKIHSRARKAEMKKKKTWQQHEKSRSRRITTAKRREKDKKTVFVLWKQFSSPISSSTLSDSRWRLVQEKRKFECRRAIQDRVNGRGEMNYPIIHIRSFSVRTCDSWNDTKKISLSLFRVRCWVTHAQSSATALIFMKINDESSDRRTFLFVFRFQLKQQLRK